MKGKLTARQLFISDAAFVAFICFLVLALALPGFITRLLCGLAAMFAVLSLVAVRVGS
jgi:hypothetical protein